MMLELRCFGSAVILNGNGDQAPLRSRKHLAVLLYVTSHPQTLFTREELASLYWNGTGSRARHSLSQALYDIRATLGPILQTTNSGVQFRKGGLKCEALDFQKAVDRGHYEAALCLYRGPFAPNLVGLGGDHWERWLETERDRFQALVVIALRSSLREAELKGRWDQVSRSALHLLKIHDLDEVAHRALMRGLWMQGDAPSALAHFDKVVSRLRRDLGEEPSRQTSELGAAIAQGKQSGQTTWPVPALEGRDCLLSSIWRRLNEGSGSVVLVGERGIGKSTLAQHVAALAQSYGTRLVDPLTRVDEVKVQRPPHLHETGGSFAIGIRRCASLAIVDDGHRIGAEAADHVIQHLQGCGCALLLIVDLDALLSAGHPPLAEYVVGEGGAIVRLPPINPGPMSRLLRRRVDGLSDRIVQLAVSSAGGNPLYALSIAELLLDESTLSFDSLASAALRGLLEERIRSLDGASRELLRAIAILGSEVQQTIVRGLMNERSQFARALVELENRGLIERGTRRSEGGLGWRTRARVLQQYMRWQSGDMHCAALHLVAAQVCKELPQSDGVCVARQLAAAGEREDAFREACLAMQGALGEGRVAKALEAAVVARSVATNVHERRVSRLLEGELELVRGAYGSAYRILMPLLFEGNASVEEAVSLRLSLSTSAIRIGSTEEACLWYKEAREAIEKLGAPSPALRLRMAALEFELAGVLGCKASGVPHQERVSNLLSTITPATSEAKNAWCDAWQVYLPHLLDSVSVAEARRAVAYHSRVLSELPPSRGPIGLTSQGLVAIREGRLAVAESTFREALSSLSENAPSRCRSLLLNNLAVAYLEQGRFREARRLLNDACEVDCALEAPTADRVIPLLNLASDRLYNGRLAEAEAFCRQVLTGLDGASLPGLHGEASACIGLVTLAKGRKLETVILGESPLETGTNPLGCDRLKVAWLEGFLASQRDAEEGAELLRMSSDRERRFDAVAAAKLSILADLAYEAARAGEPPQALPVEAWREEGSVSLQVAWFGRTALRWWTAAMHGRRLQA